MGSQQAEPTDCEANWAQQRFWVCKGKETLEGGTVVTDVTLDYFTPGTSLAGQKDKRLELQLMPPTTTGGPRELCQYLRFFAPIFYLFTLV